MTSLFPLPAVLLRQAFLSSKYRAICNLLMIFALVYATIKAIPGKDGYERMEEKTLRETDEAVDAAQADEMTAPVDDTPAEQAEPTEQAVTLREDKVPESEEYDEDEEDDDEEDDDEAVEEEVDNTPPYCDKVFGVYRLALYGICFGYGGGLLVTGLFGIITGREVTTSSIPGIVGAVIGYLIGAYATKRLQAKAKAEAEAAEAAAQSTESQAE